MDEQEYIKVEDAANEIGVTKATLYYYTKALDIKTKRFPLDRNAYLSMKDFKQIKDTKDQARSRGVSKEDKCVA